MFGIHSFDAMTTLLSMSLSPAMNMWLTNAADGGCGADWTLHTCMQYAPSASVTYTFQVYRLAGAARCPLLMTTGTSTSTGVDFVS